MSEPRVWMKPSGVWRWQAIDLDEVVADGYAESEEQARAAAFAALAEYLGVDDG